MRPMGIWLDGFQRVTPAPTAYAGTMVPGAPRRFVCHTTEGLSRNPAGAAAGHPNPPHLWVCLPSHPYAPRARVQIYSLDVSARALNHDKADPETNKQGAIQVEIEGRAAEAGGWSRNDLDWLADAVIGPACAATGVDVSRFVAGVGDSKVAAGRFSSTRMSWEQWRTFNGICSHQNVPGNDHWDAGGLDLAYISARLTGSVPLEDDMTPEQAALLSAISAAVANTQAMSAATNAAVGRLEVAVLDPTSGIRTILMSHKAETGSDADPKAIAQAVVEALPADLARQVLVELGDALPKS